MKSRIGRWSPGLLVVVLVAGCGAAEQTEAAPSGESAPAASAVSAEAQRLEYLEDYAAERGIVDPPEVDVVRWVESAESSSALAGCLTEEGFPATVDDDGGGFEVELTAEQEPAYNLANYVCTARYPTVPEPEGAPPEEYIRAVYDYYLDDLVPCLDGAGADVGDVPTWETFRDTFTSATEQWHPYLVLVEAGRLTPELREACPLVPVEELPDK